jgi:hypothetical protein
MTPEKLQRMNVRIIRVTLRSALRHIGPEQASLCIGRARLLLDHARSEATFASVLTEIEALQAELEDGIRQYRKES